MSNDISSNVAVAAGFGLVGRNELLEIIWPNETSRPHWRTFERMKSNGSIPFVKVGKLCWYEPQTVLNSLIENHTVRRKWNPNATTARE
jgi:hypothetical protein